MLITIGFTSETIFYLLLTPRVPGPRQPQVQGSIKLCGEVRRQSDNHSSNSFQKDWHVINCIPRRSRNGLLVFSVPRFERDLHRATDALTYTVRKCQKLVWRSIVIILWSNVYRTAIVLSRTFFLSHISSQDAGNISHKTPAKCQSYSSSNATTLIPTQLLPLDHSLWKVLVNKLQVVWLHNS